VLESGQPETEPAASSSSPRWTWAAARSPPSSCQRGTLRVGDPRVRPHYAKVRAMFQHQGNTIKEPRASRACHRLVRFAGFRPKFITAKNAREPSVSPRGGGPAQKSPSPRCRPRISRSTPCSQHRLTQAKTLRVVLKSTCSLARGRQERLRASRAPRSRSTSWRPTSAYQQNDVLMASTARPSSSASTRSRRTRTACQAPRLDHRDPSRSSTSSATA